MTSKMKRWLHDRGITAVEVANKAGVPRADLYRQLRGTMPVAPELRHTLLRTFGMTPREYEEVIPR